MAWFVTRSFGVACLILFLLQILLNRKGLLELREMRKFDPWPIFFRREWNRNWPFLTGFAITGAIIVKMTASLTEEDIKNSPFAQAHKRNAAISIYFLQATLLVTLLFLYRETKIRSNRVQFENIFYISF